MILPVKTLFGRPGLVDGGIPAVMPGDYWPAVKAQLIEAMNAQSSAQPGGPGGGADDANGGDVLVMGPHGESATQYGYDSGEWTPDNSPGLAPALVLRTGYRHGAHEWAGRPAPNRVAARRRRCGLGEDWGDFFQDLAKTGATTASQILLKPDPGTLITAGPGGSTIYRQPTGSASNLPVGAGSLSLQGQPTSYTALAVGAAVVIGLVVVVIAVKK